MYCTILGGGILPNGYLGVDVFLVIGGYLMMKSISRSQESGGFSYWRFLLKRIVRLWPLILIISLAALCIGYFLMIPDDYENVGETVIASSVFANNILACITTRDYWNPSNTYRPLKHTWYVCLLMQAYVVIPAILALAGRFGNDRAKLYRRLLAGLTCASLVLYLLPCFLPEQKFYYLPFRTFEITLGGWIAILPVDRTEDRSGDRKALEAACLVGLIALFCLRGSFLPSPVALLLTVLCTALLLAGTGAREGSVCLPVKCIAAVGKRSLSVYLWHQVIIAFMYYSFVGRLSFASAIICLGIIACVSALSYRWIEVPLKAAARTEKRQIRTFAACTAFALVLCAGSGWLYLHAGVVRDVPELGIVKGEGRRGMHVEYNNNVIIWDRDFSNDARVKVLVVGNSFGRDWANVLAESDIADQIELSYVSSEETSEYYEERMERFEQAKYVFYALGPEFDDVPENFATWATPEKLFAISNKRFGFSNGIIYSHRNDPDYYSQTIDMGEEWLSECERQKALYSDHYIDLIGAVQREDGSIAVFTPDGKLISQDCLHLTRFGAQYFAQALDLSWIVLD